MSAKVPSGLGCFLYRVCIMTIAVGGQTQDGEADVLREMKQHTCVFEAREAARLCDPFP